YPLASPEETNMFVSWAKELVRQLRLAWRLFKDRRVPWALKLIPPAALIYVLAPIDILPDLGLGLGQLDDIAIVLLALKLFIELAPAEVVREHLQALGAKISEWVAEEEPSVVEGEFEVKKE
ncbi:MAG: YkvA family protein, partial [Anaerolineae bacterium]